MIKPDVIVSWPRNCDYPLWRDFIRKNRERFNLIIIAFTETNQGEDYREFIKQAMHADYVLFLDAPQPRGDEDWRDLAIHQALLHSYNAGWIWFTEQDFITLPGFWEKVDEGVSMGCEVIATYDEKRMHPCNIFIKRETLQEKTSKRFGIIPDISDHFSIFQKDLESNNAVIGIVPEETYLHLNGLSHNMTLIYNGEQPNWQPDVFKNWLEESLKVPVPLDDRFISLAQKALA